MRRTPRDMKGFDILRAFDEYARARGESLHDEQAAEAFAASVATALREQRQTPTVLHGLRVQSMFLYVAAALGECEIITEEDSGDFFSTSGDVQRPDFRVLTSQGKELLVEVKSVRARRKIADSAMNMKEKYVAKLRRYADRFGRELKLATYWSGWNLWTMVAAERLRFKDGRCRLAMQDAMKDNEMALVGDRMVGTVPPLTMKFFTERSKRRAGQADGPGKFTIARVALYSGEAEIRDRNERELAVFFMQYGGWPVQHLPAERDGGDLISFGVRAVPPGPVPYREFEILGALSSMVSMQYNAATAPGGEVLMLSPREDPGSYGILIPQDYRGKALHLWRFEQHPTYEELAAGEIG